MLSSLALTYAVHAGINMSAFLFEKCLKSRYCFFHTNIINRKTNIFIEDVYQNFCLVIFNKLFYNFKV